MWHPGILLVSFGLVLLASATANAQPKRLNIISIVTDDQARWSVGAYGNKQSRTPNMDRLAREGALFKNAFVATPVCSPSRASFLSGRYGTQVGIHDWINPKEAEGGLGLPREAVTWIEVLKQQGYFTGLIGKWHLGMLPQFHPTRRGFDHFFGFLGGGNTPMNPTLEVNGKNKKFTGSLPDILTDNAMDFVRQNRARPFALCLHFRAPHAPYGPVPEEDSKPFQDVEITIPDYPGLPEKEVKKLTREYYSSIHSVDRNLGRLLALLDELGLAENTIVLFTSDHGYNIGHHGLIHKGNGAWLVMGELRGKRRPNMFETSLAVPLLIRWPGVVRPGTRIDEMVSNIDTFASVLGMLKVVPPADYKHEGKDFSPLLRGEKIPWREAVFAQYDMHTGDKAHMRSVRTIRWHLVRQYSKNQPDELFDLQNDPDERVNLYNDANHRETRDRLQQQLERWQKEINDPLVK
jgi:choline-sulfatase